MTTRTSNTWAENLDQVGWDFCDGLCSYEGAVERLMRDCGFDMPEAISHLDCFSPPKDEP